MFDQIFQKLKSLLQVEETVKDIDRKDKVETNLVNLPPLSSFFFHETRIDTGHNFIEILTILSE